MENNSIDAFKESEYFFKNSISSLIEINFFSIEILLFDKFKKFDEIPTKIPNTEIIEITTINSRREKPEKYFFLFFS